MSTNEYLKNKEARMFNEERVGFSQEIRELKIENENLKKEVVYFMKLAFMVKPMQTSSINKEFWADEVERRYWEGKAANKAIEEVIIEMEGA